MAHPFAKRARACRGRLGHRGDGGGGDGRPGGAPPGPQPRPGAARARSGRLARPVRHGLLGLPRRGQSRTCSVRTPPIPLCCNRSRRWRAALRSCGRDLGDGRRRDRCAGAAEFRRHAEASLLGEPQQAVGLARLSSSLPHAVPRPPQARCPAATGAHVDRCGHAQRSARLLGPPAGRAHPDSSRAADAEVVDRRRLPRSRPVRGLAGSHDGASDGIPAGDRPRPTTAGRRTHRLHAHQDARRDGPHRPP